jgi:glyoxylase-like metal-dependent hydrolase (beta-lactamase superfamily II)
MLEEDRDVVVLDRCDPDLHDVTNYRRVRKVVVMRSTVVIPGMHRISLGYVNAYLIESEDGLVVVDAGLPGGADGISAAVEGVGRRISDVTDILVTHYHYDHVGGLRSLADSTGARVWAHPSDAAVIRSGDSAPKVSGRGVLGGLMTLFSSSRSSEACEVTTEVHGGERLPVAGGIEVMHTPGHTPGHVSFLWVEGRALIAGDAAGNVLGLGPMMIGEDHDAASASFSRLAVLDFKTAVFGHGKPIVDGASERFLEAAGRLSR